MQLREQFRVEGLDCAEEVLLLRRELEDRPGIDELEFDVLNARMVVSFDPEVTSADAIVEAVRRVGLTARPWSAGVSPESQTWWNRHGRGVTTGISGVLLVAGFLTHAIVERSLAAAFAHATPGAGLADAFYDIPLLARLFYLGSILSGIWFVAPRAWGSLRRLQPDMNLLMCIAVTGAIAIGELFEAATVTFLFALALLLEHWSMERTRRAFAALMNLSPPTARVLSDCGHFHEKPVEAVATGARILVRPHERIPLDGRVLKGASSGNQAPITGESVPVAK
jgi:Zn2+/Cd2+-exporting ATPase